MTFKVGDKVLLMSGSPPMTVTDLDDDGTVYCSWFSATHQDFQQSSFPTEALKLQPSNSEGLSPEMAKLFSGE